MPRKPTGRPDGRPVKPIDWDQAERLLEAGCLGTEVAAYFDVHPETFYRRIEEKFGFGFTEFMAQKRQRGCSILRAAQYKKAIKGDNSMLIWLGKQRLDQRETPNEITVSPETVSHFDDLMKQIRVLQGEAKSPSKTKISESKS